MSISLEALIFSRFSVRSVLRDKLTRKLAVPPGRDNLSEFLIVHCLSFKKFHSFSLSYLPSYQWPLKKKNKNDIRILFLKSLNKRINSLPFECRYQTLGEKSQKTLIGEWGVPSPRSLYLGNGCLLQTFLRFFFLNRISYISVLPLTPSNEPLLSP